MALNPIQFTRQVTDEFRRYQLTAFPLADPRLAEQARGLLGTGAFDRSPLTKGPYVSLARGFKPGAELSALAAEGLIHPTLTGVAEHPSLFAHQEATLRAALGGKHVLVSTGTGSGKTESFLYPIIDHCLRLQDEGAPAGVTAVLVYPMNALASDQRDRLRSLLAGTGITYGMFVGSTPSNPAGANVRRLPEGDGREALRQALARKRRNDLDPVPFEECASEQEIRERRPRILITNANQLELLLTRKQDAGLFSGAPLSFVVLDEAHTYSGASGAEVACLIRRVRGFARRSVEEVTCIATSATIVDPEGSNEVAPEFLSRLCGVPQEQVALVEEQYQELSWPGQRLIPQAPDDPEAVLAQVLDALTPQATEEGEALDVPALEQAVGALTGTAPSLSSDDPARALYDALFGMEPVRILAEELRHPLDLETVTAKLRERLGRTGEAPEGAAAELLAYLALGAFASLNDAPLLRPKLHVFVRGLEGAVMTFDGTPLDVHLHFSRLDALQTGEADRLPTGVFDLSVCRTCGQHYGTAHLRAFDTEGGAPMGGEATGESGYWLPDPDPETPEQGRVRFTDVLVSEGDEADEDPVAAEQAKRRTQRLETRRTTAHVCVRCGAFHREAEEACANPECGRPGPMAEVFMVHEAQAGFRCLGCNAQSRSPSGRRIEPIRPLRATTVADVHILAQEMISAAGSEDERRLLVFADNRQDAAFQAGWMRDHARRYRLRYLMLQQVQELEGKGPASIGDLHAELTRRLWDDRDLARALAPEAFKSAANEAYGRANRRDLERFLRIQVLRELATSFAQRDGLERWGQMRVVYAGLEAQDKRVAALAHELELEPAEFTDGLASLLDVWRRAGLLHDEDEPIFGRWHREGSEDILRGFIPFGFTERPPNGVELERQDGQIDRHLRTVISSRGRTGAFDFVAKWGVEDPRTALTFCWELLRELELVRPVTLTGSGGKPLPGTGGAHQVDTSRMGLVSQHERYCCSQCRRVHARPTPKGACTKTHCQGRVGRSDPPADDYNVSLLNRPFAMVAAEEHTAQVPAERRAVIEAQFKRDGGSVNALVATPTLELGVDIGALDLVLCRNVPPTPANYWQRVGRAGRRRRMAVVYVYCRNAVHDTYFFDDPTQLLGAPLRPPRFNLKNDVLVTKHVHATVLSELLRIAAGNEELLARYHEALPQFVRDWVFEDEGRQARATPADVSSLSALIDEHRSEVLGAVRAVFASHWPAEAAAEVDPERLDQLVLGTGPALQQLVDRLHERLGWVLDTQARLLAEEAQGRQLSEDERRQVERCRAYVDGLKQQHVRTYTLSVLAGDGFLPGYGIYDGGITAFPGRRGAGTNFELSRPQAVAVREFVPGNRLYANGGSYRTGRFHFPVTGQRQRVDTYVADLESGYITAKGQPSSGYGSGAPVEVEALRISDVDLAYTSPIRDEENERFQLPVTVLGMPARLRRGGKAYRSGAVDVHHILGQGLRLINVGPADKVRALEPGFPVCTVCGAARSPYASDAELASFDEWHKRECGRSPDHIALTAEIVADALRIGGMVDQAEAANLGEALRIGAAQVLQMEPDDLQILPVPCANDSFDLFVYDPMPGGSGLLAQMLERWDEIVDVLQTLLGACPGACESSCYRCMRTGRNVFWHRMLDRSVALEVIDRMREPPRWELDLPAQQDEAFGERPASTNDAEDRLVGVLIRHGLDGFAEGQHRITLPEPFGSTTPDIAWPAQKVALYLDGLSEGIHGSALRRRQDELLRDALEEEGWTVVEMAVSHLDDPRPLRASLRRLARALQRPTVADELRAVPESELIGADSVPAVRPFETHLPLYNVRAAAGRFLENLEPEADGWIPVAGPLDEAMFAVTVAGDSMAPGIPDGAQAVFRAGGAGSRAGKVVLAELEEAGGPSHVVKRYASEKAESEEGWEHSAIRLCSDNPEHPDIDVEPGRAIRVVGEFVRVVAGTAVPGPTQQ